MEENKYQAISGIDNVLQYLDDMDGFHDYPIGNLTYDGSTFSITIEEVLEGEDWPNESNGRVWMLEFSHVSDIDIEIDVPLGLWIDDINMNDDGAFVIQCNQGTVTILANSVELSAPVENVKQAGGIASFIPTSADDAPLKGVFNDIKGMITKKRADANEDNEVIEPAAETQPVPEPEPARPNPFLQNPAPAAPVAAPTPAAVPAAQPPSEPIVSTTIPPAVAPQPTVPPQPVAPMQSTVIPPATPTPQTVAPAPPPPPNQMIEPPMNGPVFG